MGVLASTMDVILGFMLGLIAHDISKQQLLKWTRGHDKKR